MLSQSTTFTECTMFSSAEDLSFHVELDRQIYSPGQLVRAEIIVNVIAPIEIRCIQAIFKGGASTCLEGQQNETPPVKVKKSQVGAEVYFNEVYCLVGVKNGPGIHFETGKHVYNSEFQLPTTLPSSFKHEFGTVCYEVQITADLADLDLAQHKETFTVLPPLDLNSYPHLRESVKAENSTTFGYFCWRSKPLTVILKLPAGGFTISENIPISIQVDNFSYVNIDTIQVKLYESLTFRSNNSLDLKKDLKKDRREIASTFFVAIPCAVLKGSSKLFSGRIVISAGTQLTNLNHCGIIECKYLIVATAITTGNYMDLDVEKEITIGSIPFNTDEVVKYHIDDSKIEPGCSVSPSSVGNVQIEYSKAKAIMH